MNAAVDFLFCERDLELVREQSFRADSAERLRDFLVAERFERDDLAADAAFLESTFHHSRLAKSELRCSSGNANDVFSHVNARSIASTKPSIVDSSASSLSSIPAARIASDVAGPMDAAGEP